MRSPFKSMQGKLQGRMLGNPYSSKEPGMGPLMREVKNKICMDCELGKSSKCLLCFSPSLFLSLSSQCNLIKINAEKYALLYSPNKIFLQKFFTLFYVSCMLACMHAGSCLQ